MLHVSTSHIPHRAGHYAAPGEPAPRPHPPDWLTRARPTESVRHRARSISNGPASRLTKTSQRPIGPRSRDTVRNPIRKTPCVHVMFYPDYPYRDSASPARRYVSEGWKACGKPGMPPFLPHVRCGDAGLSRQTQGGRGDMSLAADATITARLALLPDGWRRDVRLTLADGWIAQVETDVAGLMAPDRVLMPGLVDAHAQSLTTVNARPRRGRRGPGWRCRLARLPRPALDTRHARSRARHHAPRLCLPAGGRRGRRWRSSRTFSMRPGGTPYDRSGRDARAFYRRRPARRAWR